MKLAFLNAIPLYRYQRNAIPTGNFNRCNEGGFLRASSKRHGARYVNTILSLGKGQCISEVAVGDQFIGKVSFVGPAESSWLDIGVTSREGKPILARLRYSRGKAGTGQGEAVGSIISVHVRSVQTDSGRIEVRKGLRSDATEHVPDNPLMISDVRLGDKLNGVISAVGSYGAVVDAKIYRVANRGRIVKCTGLLPRQYFKEDWGSQADLVTSEKVSRMLKAGEKVDVWIRKVHPENAFLLFDGSIVDVEEIRRERASYMRSMRKRRRRLPMASLEKGERHVGIVTNVLKYGVFVDIGVKREGLIHYSRMTDRHKWDWKEFEAGLELYVEVHDIVDDRLSLSLVEVKDEILSEVTDRAKSATARVHDVLKAKELKSLLRRSKSKLKSKKQASSRTGEDVSKEDESRKALENEDEEDVVEKFSDEYYEDKYGF
ncbi:hypothetical protein BWQ96_01507 [Gracilariopsis chorda]|uniref:S1 motif domain-containing protein n=1 Tax=Gracilariopsis chorda TaxID=448386 RepID=A0A2V3J2Q0_9FLOR|nr:hypothetical protein BWQ96_01507 [Gracilariopsis chorda]|eukprot:PXF48655.1 hypothetical protein BWQ96_01507 [Gracilariopsis chorda]